jgi:hypothetical protein
MPASITARDGNAHRGDGAAMAPGALSAGRVARVGCPVPGGMIVAVWGRLPSASFHASSTGTVSSETVGASGTGSGVSCVTAVGSTTGLATETTRLLSRRTEPLSGS